MDEVISRQAAIDGVKTLHEVAWKNWHEPTLSANIVIDMIKDLPSAQPEIVRCKDCKFYSPMNRETKTGICNLTMHQNFGDNWFCAGAERKTDEAD